MTTKTLACMIIEVWWKKYIHHMQHIIDIQTHCGYKFVAKMVELKQTGIIYNRHPDKAIKPDSFNL